jgi:hypothetical protein
MREVSLGDMPLEMGVDSISGSVFNNFLKGEKEDRKGRRMEDAASGFFKILGLTRLTICSFDHRGSFLFSCSFGGPGICWGPAG